MWYCSSLAANAAAGVGCLPMTIVAFGLPLSASKSVFILFTPQSKQAVGTCRKRAKPDRGESDQLVTAESDVAAVEALVVDLQWWTLGNRGPKPIKLNLTLGWVRHVALSSGHFHCHLAIELSAESRLSRQRYSVS
jgi:hypothetical protein